MDDTTRDKLEQLFDTSHRDHVCETLNEQLRPPIVPEFNSSKGLREYIIKPLEKLVSSVPHNRNDIIAARDMLAELYTLARCLDKNASFTGNDNPADKLRKLWTEFIAESAAHLISHDRPNRRAINRKSGRKGGAQRKLPETKKLKDEFDKLLSDGKSKADANNALATRYGVNTPAVRKALNKKDDP